MYVCFLFLPLLLVLPQIAAFKCGQKDVGFFGTSLFEETFHSLCEAFPFSHTGPMSVLSQDSTFLEAVLLPFSRITPPCKPASASTQAGLQSLLSC